MQGKISPHCAFELALALNILGGEAEVFSSLSSWEGVKGMCKPHLAVLRSYSLLCAQQ